MDERAASVERRRAFAHRPQRVVHRTALRHGSKIGSLQSLQRITFDESISSRPASSWTLIARPRQGPQTSRLYIWPTVSKVRSASVLSSKSGGLLVLKLTGVPPGPHGLHLHAGSTCDPPKFDTAGPHYDPGTHKHGSKNPAGPHAGDMPNVIARADSSVDTTLAIPASVVSAVGHGMTARTLVLHAGADDLATDPSGNSGPRFACGVLEA